MRSMNFESRDTKPLIEVLHGDILESVQDSEVKAFWFPSQSMMTTPLKHAPSIAMIHANSGQVWMVGANNQAWTNDLIHKAAQYLTTRDSRAFPTLGEGLSEHLQWPMTVNPVKLLIDLPKAFRIDDLASAVFRRWLSEQSPTPDMATLRQVQSMLLDHFKTVIEEALNAFLNDLDTTAALQLRPSGIPVDHFNYLVCSSEFRLARCQFHKIHPFLSAVTFRAQPRSVWDQLRIAVDCKQPYLKPLCKTLNVGPAAVRALQFVTPEDVGEFIDRPQELLGLLDSLCAEHAPRSADQWRLFQDEYRVSKKMFSGRSSSSNILLKGRLDSLMGQAVKGKPVVVMTTEGIQSIECLRAGLVQSVLAFDQLERNEIHIRRDLRARVGMKVDQFLGKLAWRSLLDTADRWDARLAEGMERNDEAIQFLSGQNYFDYLPSRKFVARNGFVAYCLLQLSELTKQGVGQALCLASPGFRSTYHRQCIQGKVTIVAIENGDGAMQSTARFRIDQVANSTGKPRFDFVLVEHQGHKNTPPSLAARVAVDALNEYFKTRECQDLALKGCHFNTQRSIAAHHSSVSPAILAAGIEAFRATFGARSDELIRLFLQGNVSNIV
jgi:hypothetical protein